MLEPWLVAAASAEVEEGLAEVNELDMLEEEAVVALLAPPFCCPLGWKGFRSFPFGGKSGPPAFLLSPQTQPGW